MLGICRAFTLSCVHLLAVVGSEECWGIMSSVGRALCCVSELCIVMCIGVLLFLCRCSGVSFLSSVW